MNRLHISEITSIGAVESGDDPEATILLYKSKTEAVEPGQGQIEKKEGSMPFDIESLTDEGKEFVAGLQSQIASLSEDTPAALPDDLPDVVKSRLDDADATIAKMQAEKDQVANDLASLKDEMATEKWTARAQALAVLLGSPEDVAPVLKTLAVDSPDAFAKLDAMFDTLIVKDAMAPFFKEIGDSSATGSAVDQINAHATEIRKNQPEMSMVDARAEAWRQHPELKAQSREEA